MDDVDDADMLLASLQEEDAAPAVKQPSRLRKGGTTTTAQKRPLHSEESDDEGADARSDQDEVDRNAAASFILDEAEEDDGDANGDDEEDVDEVNNNDDDDDFIVDDNGEKKAAAQLGVKFSDDTPVQYEVSKLERAADSYYSRNNDKQLWKDLDEEERDALRKTIVRRPLPDEPKLKDTQGKTREFVAEREWQSMVRDQSHLAPLINKNPGGYTAEAHQQLSAHHAQHPMEHFKAVWARLERDVELSKQENDDRQRCVHLINYAVALAFDDQNRVVSLRAGIAAEAIKYLDGCIQKLENIGVIVLVAKLPRIGGVKAWANFVRPFAILHRRIVPQHYPGLRLPAEESSLDPAHMAARWYQREKLQNDERDWINPSLLLRKGHSHYVLVHKDSQREHFVMGSENARYLLHGTARLLMWEDFIKYAAHSVIFNDEEIARPESGRDGKKKSLDTPQFARAVKSCRGNEGFVLSLLSMMRACCDINKMHDLYQEMTIRGRNGAAQAAPPPPSEVVSHDDDELLAPYM